MYIRTKNRIYQVESTLRDNGFVKGYNIGYMAFITKDQVIKQSENLEELCDEFVLHYGDTMQTSIPIPWATYERLSDNWSKNKEMLIKELNNNSGRNAIVLGAIYTDKGLIYVAKMDNEGKLVLI